MFRPLGFVFILQSIQCLNHHHCLEEKQSNEHLCLILLKSVISGLVMILITRLYTIIIKVFQPGFIMEFEDSVSVSSV